MHQGICYMVNVNRDRRIRAIYERGCRTFPPPGLFLLSDVALVCKTTKARIAVLSHGKLNGKRSLPARDGRKSVAQTLTALGHSICRD